MDETAMRIESIYLFIFFFSFSFFVCVIRISKQLGYRYRKNAMNDGKVNKIKYKKQNHQREIQQPNITGDTKKKNETKKESTVLHIGKMSYESKKQGREEKKMRKTNIIILINSNKILFFLLSV